MGGFADKIRLRVGGMSTFYLGLLLGAMAFLVAFFYLLDIAAWPSAMIAGHNARDYEFTMRGTDMASYVGDAEDIIHGTGPREPFYRAPLYPFFLAPVLILKDSIFAIGLAHCALFAGILFFSWRLGEMFFGRLAGLVAFLMLLCYGGFLFYVGLPLSTMLETFLATMSLHALCLWRVHRTWKTVLWAGAAAALVCLARPNYLAVAPLGLLLVGLEQYFSEKRLQRRFVIQLAAGLLLFALFLIPAVAWNNLFSKEKGFILLNTNGPPTYRLCNSYDSTVFNFIYPKEPLMPVASLAFWKHQAKKALGFWTGSEVPQNANFYIFRENSLLLSLLPLNFGVLGAFFLAAVLFFGREWKRLWPIFLYSGIYILTVIAFYIIARFRMPVVPVMSVLAAAFVCKLGTEFWRRYREKDKACQERVPWCMILCFLLAAAICLASRPWEELRRKEDWEGLAAQRMRQLDISSFRDIYKRLSEDNPSLVTARIFYASASALCGDYENALRSVDMLSGAPMSKEILDATRADIICLSEIRGGRRPLSDWESRCKGELGGHVAFLYLSFARIAEERRDSALPVLNPVFAQAD